MNFYNASNSNVILCINSVQHLLMPGDAVDVDCGDDFSVVLKHPYKSTALSEAEIANDDMDASIISVLAAPYKPPYFAIVLDSRYRIIGSANSTVRIQRERIRPTYACSYDRFYPQISQGSVTDISHTFPEKKQFESHYKSATSKGSTRILTILLIVLGAGAIPLIILLAFINILLAIAVLILCVLGLGAVWGGVSAISSCISKAEHRHILSGFESSKITHYYSAAKSSPTPKFDLTID